MEPPLRLTLEYVGLLEPQKLKVLPLFILTLFAREEAAPLQGIIAGALGKLLQLWEYMLAGQTASSSMNMKFTPLISSYILILVTSLH